MGIITLELETKIRRIARSLGYTDTPLKSEGTHQIELCFSGRHKIYCYLDRKTGLTKGELQLVINPDTSQEVFEQFSYIDGLKQADPESDIPHL
ncbi:hypothetical protein, partial [Vibrio breoganii]